MKKPSPTPSELMILQVLWEEGPSTVKHVHEKLSKTKDVGYTTTLKIMQVMNEKKLLSREVDGKRHIYNSLIEEEDMQDALLEKLLNVTFKGSALKLVMKALGNNKTSRKELNKIKQFINDLDQQQNGNS